MSGTLPSKQEARALEVIRQHTAVVGSSPTLRVIGERLGVSTERARQLVARLTVKGVVRRRITGTRAYRRSIELVEAA